MTKARPEPDRPAQRVVTSRCRYCGHAFIGCEGLPSADLPGGGCGAGWS
jgi:hypothetical protein